MGYRKANIDTLGALAKFHSNKKDFEKMTREDILLYLDSLGKPEASDPLHKWIGTYATSINSPPLRVGIHSLYP
jgi:hypothetical protein